jgi:hypothetical protein
MKLNKRPATPEEVEKTLLEHMRIYNRNNPNHAQPEEYWRQKLAKAEADGYKNEVCECGMVYLAFHHYVTCQKKECPFSCGKTMFELWQEEIDQIKKINMTEEWVKKEESSDG